MFYRRLCYADRKLGLFNAMTSLGNAIGSFGTGALTDRFGYRNTQFGACVFSIGVILLQVFAVNNIMIVVGKLLNGIVRTAFKRTAKPGL